MIKNDKIEEIGDLFEYGQIEKSQIIESVYLLLNSALNEQDDVIRESLFNAIKNAVIYQNVGEQISWDAILSNIKDLSGSDLEYALLFLGFSHNNKYISTIQEYLDHSDSDIRRLAQEALVEITYYNK